MARSTLEVSGPRSLSGAGKASGGAADPALVAEETVTCVVQVSGKVRARLEVPPGIGEHERRERALHAGKVIVALDGARVRNVIVKAPGLVNIVPG